MKKERDRIRNKIIKQEKNRDNFAFKFHKIFQMTVVSFLHQITSDIMVKGKSSFSLCPERKMTNCSGRASERKWNFLLTK